MQDRGDKSTLPLVKTELFSICTTTVGLHIVKPEEFQIGKGKSYLVFSKLALKNQLSVMSDFGKDTVFKLIMSNCDT